MKALQVHLALLSLVLLISKPVRAAAVDGMVAQLYKNYRALKLT
jgi:hypothetical protein